MNKASYIGFTLALFALEIWLSIVIEDISNVFGVIGTIAGTSLSFFIPSVLYCKAYNQFGKKESKTLYIIAILNFLLGVVFCGGAVF